MKHLNFVMKSILSIVVVIVMTSLWVGAAAAAGPNNQQRDSQALKYGLKVALIRLETQQNNLNTAQKAADVAAEFIQDEKAAGRDTSALETALANLRAKLDEAQTAHDQAAQILKDKAGFDADGNVTDPDQARETLQSARQSMQKAADALRDGRQAFQKAMRDYRQSKRNNK
jgi:hypothetical protein